MKSFFASLMIALSLALLACGGGGGGSGAAPANPNPNPDPLVITTNALAQAQVDIVYSAFVAASGGSGAGNYQFSFAADSPQQLPPPLILNPTTGEIRGLPQAGSEGAYVLKINVNDGMTDIAKTLSIVINARLSVATTILASATEGTAYSAQLASVGGFANRTWSLDASSADQLPAGLSVNAAGTISGTPTSVADGNYQLTFAVSDGTTSATRPLSLFVSDAALEIAAATLAPAQSGVAFTAPAFVATGGTGVYAWSLSPQSVDPLPAGMMLSAAGVLSGTPGGGTDGFHNLLVRVTSGAFFVEREFVLQIGTPAMEITTSGFASMEVAEQYNVTLTAGGGDSNYTWALAPTSGPLPVGLTLSAAGVLSGVPEPGQEGTHNFIVRLEDTSANINQKNFSITITEADALDVKFAFSSSNINHFLTRAQFGVTEEALAALQTAGGVENYVDQMLSKEASPTIIDSALNTEITNPQFPSRTQLARYWEHILVRSDAPFQETMALFWHDHFATGTPVLGATNLYYHVDHIETVRSRALGSFRQLLFDLSIDKHMLIWLDGRLSRVGRPNENFAREFWELFTLGVDNGYNQDDIEEAARVFTGFRQTFNGSQHIVTFYEPWHDTTNKVIFGETVVGRSGSDSYLEYLDLIDLTLLKKPVAEFIVKKLWEYFAYMNPSQEIIDGLAKTFRDSNWELKPVLRQMFLSNAFYATNGVEPRAKSPIEFAVGLMRSSQLEVPIWKLDSYLTLTGHRPTDPPDVSGWPSDQQWLSADAMIQRANFAALVRNERSHQAGLNQGVVNLLPPAANRSAAEVVDHIAGLLNINLTIFERDSYIDYLNTTISGGNPLPNAFDGSNQEHLEERARGLLYVMAQNPNYQFR